MALVSGLGAAAPEPAGAAGAPGAVVSAWRPRTYGHGLSPRHPLAWRISARLR
ncbi:hypothetical protein ACFWDI_09045 [Streptomyces sp. NPDC060064]|uniref:hypothetical protein n=1 Tax=Streptomyces sp. NPDC060064 TaxID=3347049 RepID=UPI00369635D3